MLCLCRCLCPKSCRELGLGKSKQQAVKPKAITCSWRLVMSAARLIYRQQRSLKQKAILADLLTLHTLSKQHDLYVLSLLKNSKMKLGVRCSSRTLSSCLSAVKDRKSREAIKPMPASSRALLATVEPFCLHSCWWLYWDWKPAGPSPPFFGQSDLESPSTLSKEKLGLSSEPQTWGMM